MRVARRERKVRRPLCRRCDSLRHRFTSGKAKHLPSQAQETFEEEEKDEDEEGQVAGTQLIQHRLKANRTHFGARFSTKNSIAKKLLRLFKKASKG